MFVFILFLSQFCVILCSLFSSRKQARARERERDKTPSAFITYTRVSSPSTHTQSLSSSFLFSVASRVFFLFDTHTVSWLLCISTSFFFFSFSFSLDSRAYTRIHTHTYTHKQIVICIFLPRILSPHCLLAPSRVFLFLVCAWSRVHVLRLFLFSSRFFPSSFSSSTMPTS